MIWVLEFEKYWEAKNWHTEAHSSLLSIWDIFRRRGLDCFVLYRYSLPDLQYEWVNPRKIPAKFGTSRPELLDFKNLDTNWIILYHVALFERDINKFRDLLQFCQRGEKDIFIPVPSSTKFLYGKEKFWDDILAILDEFDHSKFKLASLEEEFRFQKVIEREFKLGDLLD